MFKPRIGREPITTPMLAACSKELMPQYGCHASEPADLIRNAHGRTAAELPTAVYAPSAASAVVMGFVQYVPRPQFQQGHPPLLQARQCARTVRACAHRTQRHRGSGGIPYTPA